MSDDRRPALLVLACSARKSPHVRRGPAWEVYDGRVYQVLKKALIAYPAWESTIDVMIASARYGIISARQVIDTYDDRLSSSRSADLAPQWSDALQAGLAGRSYQSAHANLGRAYREAIPELAELLAPTPIEWASGGIGARNAQTRDWVLRRLR